MAQKYKISLIIKIKVIKKLQKLMYFSSFASFYVNISSSSVDYYLLKIYNFHLQSFYQIRSVARLKETPRVLKQNTVSFETKP